MSVIHPTHPDPHAGGSRLRPSLPDFLLARYVEEAEAYRRITGGARRAGKTHAAEHLVDLEAKRQIVERLADQIEPARTAVPSARWIAKQLALPYADHPDYDEEWRP